MFDYYYDLKKDKTFKPWSNKVSTFVYDKEASYFDLMVQRQKALDIESLANLQQQAALARAEEETAAKIHMNQSRMEVGE